MGASSKTTPTQQPSNMLTKIESAKNSGHYPPFSAEIEWNCIAPEAECEAKRAFARKESAFAEEKPNDSLQSLPRPSHREPSKSVSSGPIHPPLRFMRSEEHTSELQ